MKRKFSENQSIFLSYYNDTMEFFSFSFPNVLFKKNSPMFYSNSNGHKNYVIKLIIPKTITR
jgi:hypothetical protein